MRRYVARKVFAAFVTLFLVLVFDFMIFRLLPNDPLDVLARSVGASEADKVKELTKQYALDQPVFPDQFVVFLRQTATLDFGEEFSRGLPTWSVIGRFAPPTFILIGTATVLAAAAGIALGIRGGWRRTGALDRGATGLAVLLMSTPPFLLAMLMVTVFGGILRWFPVSGARSLGDVDGLALLADRMNHAVLPLITLTLVAFGPFYLIMRQSMVDTLGEDFLVTARAKGIGEQAVRNRHAVRNALLPIASLLALSLGVVLSGSIAIEYVFGYPGLGLLMVTASTTRNFPVLQAMFLLFSAVMIFGNLVADLTYGYLDPRIRGA
ncbi:MAG: ABC transporter permease [Actinomycetota bacterium]